MQKSAATLCIVLMIFLNVFTACEQTEKNRLIGNWSFSLPDGNPAWLKLTADTSASMLWSVGSARPADSVVIRDGELSFVRKFGWRPFGKQDVYHVTKTITGKLNDDGKLILTVLHTHDEVEDTLRLVGKKMPPLPPAPDLSALEFGEPIDLLRDGLAGWSLTNPEKINGWRIKDGVLINETPKKDFGAYGNYGNLRTNQEFMDFELTIDYNVESGGNSGIYLRGTYEVQVVDRDSPMQGIQGPGAVFGRITPTENNAYPGGEWNTYKLILVDRHITVELNDKVVINNQPLEGCTGGGINSDDTIPGPIFLQGDHTSVKYKNIVLRPAL